VSKAQENRIDRRFSKLKAQGRTAFLPFITAGDPDFETSKKLLFELPAAGADLIELGMPFSDPMADGPAIQASSLRALKAGQTMAKTLEMVKEFRSSDNETPIILMGYYNPIYAYGTGRFIADASAAGVDGVIVVDVPPEADEELCIPALESGLCFIRLATPTTDERRLPSVLQNTSGFVYYVAITGITGVGSANVEEVGAQVSRIRSASNLPVGVGFGIKTPEQVAAMSKHADAVIVGSALVTKILQNLDIEGRVTVETVPAVLDLVSELSAPLKS